MRQFIKNNRPYAQTSREDFAQKYLDEGCKEVPVLYNGSFIDPIWNGIAFVEGATPEEIEQQQIINLKQKETDLYMKRMQDAQRIWAGLSAEFRIAKQVGQMDDETENIILAELKPVLDIVVPFGQWVTGYQLLLGVGSSVIGQELYDKLHDIIWNYIQENYEEMEVLELKQSINKK